MEQLEKDFNEIKLTLTGNHRITRGVPWVEDIFVKGTPYDEAYQKLWDVRMRIGERFGIEFDDDDFELIMGTVMDIEHIIGYEMFRYGIEYAQRGFKL